jgi:thiamine biosynthesis protein ThiS
VIRVEINGEERDVPDGLTVRDLLEHLGIHPGRVAVERNLEIITRTKWDEVRIAPGDSIEIVNFVGGGWRFSR